MLSTWQRVLFSLQGSLYSFLIGKVDGFRDFIGAPETEKFNIVLLGGKWGGGVGRERHQVFKFISVLFSGKRCVRLWREERMEGGREGGREGGKDGGREGGREGGSMKCGMWGGGTVKS